MRKRVLGAFIAAAIAVNFTGCLYDIEDGQIKSNLTGNTYDAKTVYKVVKNGVTIFMTGEEIEDAGLDKINEVVITTYEIAQGKDADSE